MMLRMPPSVREFREVRDTSRQWRLFRRCGRLLGIACIAATLYGLAPSFAGVAAIVFSLVLVLGAGSSLMAEHGREIGVVR